jgi:hypothetical protein
MNNLTEMDINAIELNIIYDPAVLTATNVSLTDTVLENQNFLYAFNTNISGIIYAVFALNASHYTGTGLCLNLEFTVTGTSGDTSDITISKAIINNQAVTTSDGIFTVTPDSPPVFTDITQQTIDEDTSLSTFITINDYQTNTCDLMLTFISSDETLVSANTISYTCMSDNYYFLLTPVENQNGLATITIIAEDSGGLTASTAFDLVVSAVNDIPQFSTINAQSVNEGESIQVSFTAQDTESSTLSVTVISADQTLISNNNLTLTNDGDLYTLTVTPNTYQVGQTEITISVSDGTDSTSVTFSTTVNEVHFIVSGHVARYTDLANSDLQNVIMTLSGTYSYSTITDVSGNYAFTTVRPGSYTLTASKTDSFSLDLADAIKILKGAVKLIHLTCHEKIASDAYIDGYFGAFDAAKVARYVGGLETCLNNDCIFWQFIPEEITNCETWPLIEIESTRRYTDLNENALDQDFIGIGCGNVSQ